MRFEGFNPQPCIADVKSRVPDFFLHFLRIQRDLRIGWYYVKAAKHGEIIKAEFDIFDPLKTQGVNGGHKGTTNANPVNDYSNKNIGLTERAQYSS